VCDFQAIYTLDWWEQVWSGNVDKIILLVEGLQQRPDSLFRAVVMSELPPAPPTQQEKNITLDWYGLDNTQLMLAQLFNLLASVHTKKGGPRVKLPTQAQPDPVEEFWARIHQ